MSKLYFDTPRLRTLREWKKMDECLDRAKRVATGKNHHRWHCHAKQANKWQRKALHIAYKFPK